MTTVSITQQIENTIAAIRERGIQAELLNTPAEALQRVQALIPSGASVMTGGSRTLTEIGLDDVLIQGNHPWLNLKEAILAEKDPAKQTQLRNQSILADYFLGSPQAIVESGEMVFASASGSQLPAYSFSSNHVIWVAGIQKIVPTLDAAIKRVREYCLPKEDERIKSLGYPGSFIGKMLIMERETPALGREVRLLLVNEVLGV